MNTLIQRKTRKEKGILASPRRLDVPSNLRSVRKSHLKKAARGVFLKCSLLLPTCDWWLLMTVKQKVITSGQGALKVKLFSQTFYFSGARDVSSSVVRAQCSRKTARNTAIGASSVTRSDKRSGQTGSGR